jgi:uncharacterized protein
LNRDRDGRTLPPRGRRIRFPPAAVSGMSRRFEPLYLSEDIMSDHNVKLVQEAYAAFGRGDIPGVLAHLSDDIDWELLGPSELPTAGNRRGKTAVSGFFQQVGELWDFERFEPRQFISQADVVVALGSYSGKAKGSNRPFQAEWAHVFTIKNGKASKFREYTDTANLVNALGVTAHR